MLEAHKLLGILQMQSGQSGPCLPSSTTQRKNTPNLTLACPVGPAHAWYTCSINHMLLPHANLPY